VASQVSRLRSLCRTCFLLIVSYDTAHHLLRTVRTCFLHFTGNVFIDVENHLEYLRRGPSPKYATSRRRGRGSESADVDA